MNREDREVAAFKNRLRGWTAYGLREIRVESMRPGVVQAETTSICNLTCVFCPYPKMTRTGQMMALDNFRSFLERDCEHLDRIALHHFGEPFLNPELESFVETCAYLGLETTISTNATVLTRARAQRVIEAGLGRLIVSIDAANGETYQQLRGGRLEAVHEHVEGFLAEKLSAGRGQPFVELQFITTPENVSEAEVFIRRWSGRPGVDQVVVRPERTHGGQIIRHDGYELRGDRHPCRYLWESVVILADGRVVPCCKDYDGKEVLGNVFTGDTLASIWNSPRMQELRAHHVNGTFEHIPLCNACPEWRGHGPLGPESSRHALASFLRGKRESRVSRIFQRSFFNS